MKKYSFATLLGCTFLFVQTKAQNSWLLNGNLGTTTSHFIGTIDNNSLRFRVNNHRAGYLGNAADGNIFFGYQSGNSNATGKSNVAIGIKSLFLSTNSRNLVAIGDSALMNNSTGSANSAVGSKSLFANTTGFRNTALGWQTLFNNTIGSSNTALGTSALEFNTTGLANTATGNDALNNNTTGSKNTATGVLALRSNETGSDNTATGYESMVWGTTGRLNAAYGNFSLTWNTAGIGNTAIGAGSLHGALGSYNTAVGLNSFSTGAWGNYNVAVGDSALHSNPKGSRNTVLGSKSNTSADSLINATAIGANAQVDCSNCLVLGSTSGKNGGTTNVNVGIGRTDPAFPLTFSNALGDKISFYNTGSGRNYGIGTQNLKLQFYTDIPVANIVFGYGSSAAFTENMRVQGNGNVVIRGSVTANGILYPSDNRLKRNLEPIQNAMDRISLLRGYTFYWKEHESDSLLQSGFIAQELQSVFPELVKKDENGFLSVNYFALIPHLVQSIKEQNEQIMHLKKENERLTHLEKEINRLKELIIK